MAFSRSPAAVGAFRVGFVDVDAVVEQPVDVFASVGVVPRQKCQPVWTCLPSPNV